MTTWICKGAALAGTLLGLSACDDVNTDGILGGLMGEPAKPMALSQTQMAQGAFTLFPPEGFCIDKTTLRQQFALMARCDAFGVDRLAGGAPLGLITVSVTPLAPDEPLASAQEVADAVKLARIADEQVSNDTVTFRAEGKPPARGLDVAHWRGVARVGDQMIGVALYGAKDSRATSEEGRDVIAELISLAHSGR